MHYDLQDLRVFLAVAEEGNVSRGARRCHLAPSSVSLRIRGLEETLGVTLLERQARGVTLTRAGVVVLEHVRRCIAQLGQMHADLLPFAQGAAQHITLFANNNAIHAHLPDDLARFLSTHPRVRIAMEERLGTEIGGAVAAGQADLGIVALGPDHPDLTYLPYREDRFVVIAAAQKTMARKTRVRLADCLKEPFIALPNGTALHTYLMNQADALGARLDVCVQVSDYPAIVRLVAAGVGVSIVPVSVIAPADRERLAVIEFNEPWAERHHRICVRPETLARHPVVRAFIETLTGAPLPD
ncbi:MULTISPECIES: LysR family transcriptional regulator [Pandoraea]|uniref:LysR family transcriptional regulator n=1 Tax=Pandoraea TaxID=93217 RepID=UPI001F5DC5A9|nr:MULTISPECIES: LysR family transcriptional regulator [Pandoraea]MCI3206721.1 LysR family transcriptional regulator [Pandoraea sp. LA3]MDN4584749.1 LysR family transcriptional regulator [Pandoraea capi]